MTTDVSANIKPSFAATHAEQRAKIIETAANAFRSKGIKAVTMDDVAHLMGMSKRTLYQIFRDKESLLLAVMEDVARRHRTRTLELRQQTSNVLEILLISFEERMAEQGKVCPDFFDGIEKYPRIKSYTAKMRNRDALLARNFLETGIEQGIFRTDIDFEIVFAFLQNCTEMLVSKEFMKMHSLSHIFANSLLIVIRGCATAKGVEMIDSYLERWRTNEKI